MQADGDRMERKGPEALAKKPYSSPRIEDYGSVVELTGTGSGAIDDGGGPFAFSGAAG
ncbi:MAG: lasso RiPP family leader peptide-containing protein [Acidobacteriota bacterium]